ncbi:DUF3021 domain-containing protein [Lentilactobacillus sunkii]|jgi:uncharacterized membrane protein YhhN|uniref:DUF3021 domain-containing protein n=2 Tax=Lentilactobacillus sunkii TaxID=481719 RepID=A0A0R1KSE7_9LACO|nr:DUF3021 domain-containing protein [Lentilactobacillus sunkii]KRK86316.1 hypothetical protein FD17_GL002082 [Lentilactobacillus sunkii DSM 19904]OFA10491.1 hypothetical protein LASUN_17190 [Lentilactobacillus sunkii]
MNPLKRIGKLFLSGMEVGSVIYLLLLAVPIQADFPSPKNIFSIMIMAGIIGVFSGLLDIDDFRIELPVHFVVTFLIVVTMMAFNGWLQWQNWTFWLLFGIEYLIIYGIAWLIIFLSGNLKLKRINKTLQERNKAQKK